MKNKKYNLDENLNFVNKKELNQNKLNMAVNPKKYKDFEANIEYSEELNPDDFE